MPRHSPTTENIIQQLHYFTNRTYQGLIASGKASTVPCYMLRDFLSTRLAEEEIDAVLFLAEQEKAIKLLPSGNYLPLAKYDHTEVP